MVTLFQGACSTHLSDSTAAYDTSQGQTRKHYRLRAHLRQVVQVHRAQEQEQQRGLAGQRHVRGPQVDRRRAQPHLHAAVRARLRFTSYSELLTHPVFFSLSSMVLCGHARTFHGLSCTSHFLFFCLSSTMLSEHACALNRGLSRVSQTMFLCLTHTFSSRFCRPAVMLRCTRPGSV